MSEIRKPCAIVVDNSGSMTDVHLYLLNEGLKTVTLEPFGGCAVDRLLEIAKDFVKVYFFTDNNLDTRAQLMIKMAGNIEVIGV